MAVPDKGRLSKSARAKAKSAEYRRLVKTTHKGTSLGFGRDKARAG